MSDTIELPCVKCGNAAARVNLRGAVELVPGKMLFAAKGAARLAGKRLDTDHPSLGIEPGEIAATIDVTCIECADAESVVDNNPESAQ